MSVAAAQAAAFYREVAKTRKVWAIRDAAGFPTSTNRSGETAMPFWSSKSRAQKIITNVPAYADFEPIAIDWDEFRNDWVPGLTRDGLHVGVNWSGARATGYDITPAELQAYIEHYIANP